MRRRFMNRELPVLLSLAFIFSGALTLAPLHHWWLTRRLTMYDDVLDTQTVEQGDDAVHFEFESDVERAKETQHAEHHQNH